MVTLKHMVARLVVPDYGGRKEAMAQTVEAEIVDSVSLMIACHCLAYCSPPLVVAHFCVSDQGQTSGRGTTGDQYEGWGH